MNFIKLKWQKVDNMNIYVSKIEWILSPIWKGAWHFEKGGVALWVTNTAIACYNSVQCIDIKAKNCANVFSCISELKSLHNLLVYQETIYNRLY